MNRPGSAQPELPQGYRSPVCFARELDLAGPVRVLLGLSGGADSVSLLDMLLQDGIDVSAAHLNHGIRGEEADRDEDFCRRLCRERGVPFFCEKQDVPALARSSGEGLEEAARRARYAFFASVMQREGIPLLCTAHNADDNAETVLLHLTRGAAGRGACGIPPCRPTEGGVLIRPMLGIGKQEILAYCARRGLSYVTDSTNASDAYARNRIRLRVMPELRAVNPAVTEAFAAFCAAQREDCACLDRMAEDFLASRPRPSFRALAALPRPVCSRVLVTLARRSGANPERTHVGKLLDALARGERVRLALPGGILATLSPRRGLSFVPDERKKKNHTQTTPNGDK